MSELKLWKGGGGILNVEQIQIMGFWDDTMLHSLRYLNT